MHFENLIKGVRIFAGVSKSTTGGTGSITFSSLAFFNSDSPASEICLTILSSVTNPTGSLPTKTGT